MTTRSIRSQRSGSSNARWRSSRVELPRWHLRRTGESPRGAKGDRVEPTRALAELLLRAQSEIGEGVAITEGGRFVYANDALAHLYGYASEELCALPSFIELVVPEERAIAIDRMKVRLGDPSHALVRGEITVMHRDGHRIPVEYAVVPIDADGEPRRLYTLVRDITEQKRAQRRASIVEDRFRRMIDAVQDYAIFTLDTHGVVASWNSGAERIKGYRADEILGQSFTVFYPPEDIARGAPARALHEAECNGRSEGEGWRVRKDGTRFWANVVITAVRDDSGELVGFTKVTRDVTERRDAERRMEASLSEKETLLKEVHHRVKNNLQVISSLLSMQRRRVTDPLARELLAESHNRVRSIGLVHEKLSRAHDVASIDFAEYLRALASMLWEAHGVSESEVAPRFEGEGFTLALDVAMPCGLVVNELVSNALRHAFPDGRHGTVTMGLHVEESGDLLRLEVADDGIGLPPDFDVARVPTLGMQLVSSLAKQLHGTLQVDGAGGARFSIRFPRQSPQRAVGQ